MLKDNFELKRVKFLNNGLEVDYNDCRLVDGEETKTFHKVKCPEYPHRDLGIAANELRSYIVKLMGIMNFRNITYLFCLAKQDNELSRQFDEYFETLATRIAISEIVYDPEKNTIVFKYIFAGVDLSRLKMQTSKIMLDGEGLKFEIALQEDFEALKDEIFKYIFENKRAQLELFGETATAEPDDSLTPDDDLEGDDTFFDDEEIEQPELIEEDVHD